MNEVIKKLMESINRNPDIKTREDLEGYLKQVRDSDGTGKFDFGQNRLGKNGELDTEKLCIFREKINNALGEIAKEREPSDEEINQGKSNFAMKYYNEKTKFDIYSPDSKKTLREGLQEKIKYEYENLEKRNRINEPFFYEYIKDQKDMINNYYKDYKNDVKVEKWNPYTPDMLDYINNKINVLQEKYPESFKPTILKAEDKTIEALKQDVKTGLKFDASCMYGMIDIETKACFANISSSDSGFTNKGEKVKSEIEIC